MADPNDPKNEPVRITAPPRPETKAPGSAAESREPVRINLPARPPARPAPPPGPTVPANPSGLKKETARVGAPIPPAAPVQMKKTQPLVTMPESTAPPSVPLTVTSEPAPVIESVSMSLCWAVLGVSAVILIIQIWNYFS
jgi:hypothetical protein